MGLTTTEAPHPDEPDTIRPRWKRFALVAAGVVAGIAVLYVLATALAGAIRGPESLNVDPGIPVEVTIPPGASARSIADLLQDSGVVASSDFEDEVGRRQVADALRAGIYRLETLMPAAAVVDRLLDGPDASGGSTVRVREGGSIATIVGELAEQTEWTEADFRTALLDGSVTSPYLPDPSTLPPDSDPIVAWEGLLFPARYDLQQGATPRQILQQISDEMVDRFERIDWSRLDELGLTRYEVLTIASLIEREAGIETDRPLISSVIHNRLEAGMRLQIDASVVYARGETSGRVTADDLRIESPWNTYRIPGLPPTPIGTAREASIAAAADPADTEYFFYVLIARDGTHGFSTTYEEHQEKVEQAKADGVFE